MKGIPMKRVAVLMGTALLVLALAAPASAAKPEKHVDTFSFSYWMYSCSEVFPADPAYDFDVCADETRTTNGSWWVDGEGRPVRATAHHDGRHEVYRCDRPAHKLTGPFKYTSHMDFINYDPVQYYERSTGTFWNLHVPGGGVAFHEAGQWSTLLEWPDEADWPYFLDIYKVTGSARFDGEAVCEALAG
jgi:hypothetical protein